MMQRTSELRCYPQRLFVPALIAFHRACAPPSPSHTISISDEPVAFSLPISLSSPAVMMSPFQNLAGPELVGGLGPFLVLHSLWLAGMEISGENGYLDTGSVESLELFSLFGPPGLEPIPGKQNGN